jgi:hypothetical protein
LYLHEPFLQKVLDLGDTKILANRLIPQSTRSEFECNTRQLIQELQTLLDDGMRSPTDGKE